MTDKNHNSYLELASLVSANISGPVKCELIQKAQERLVRELVNAGVVDQTQGDELLI